MKDLQPLFRRTADGAIQMDYTPEAHRVVAEVKKQQWHQNCPPSRQIRSAAMARVRRLGGDVTDEVFNLICSLFQTQI